MKDQLDKIRRVALTEYFVAVRSKAFLIGLVMLPVFMFGALVVQHLTRDKVDLSPKKFGVVDRTGRLFETIQKQAEARNQNEAREGGEGENRPGKLVRPEFIPVEHVEEKPAQTERELEFVLSEKVRTKCWMAFVVIEAGVFESGGSDPGAVRYYTETPTFTELPNWLRGLVNEEVRKARFEKAQIDRQLVGELTRPVSFQKLGLAKKSQDGEIEEAEEENELKTFGVPAVSMFLLFMLVMMNVPALMNSVLEEKMQKISEVLVSSVSSFALMTGKVLGSLLVAMTLAVLYLSAIIVFLNKNGLAGLVPWTHYLWFLLFLVLALMIYGSICAAIGAACSEIKDSQNMMFPVIMLIMIPMMTWMPVLQSPSSSFAKALSLFPPATPMIMMLRIASPPGPAWWEIVLATALTVLFMLLTVWAAAKIFRVGILSQGQTPSLKKLVQWVFSK